MRITVKALTLYKQRKMQNRKKIKFTAQELSAKGFFPTTEGGETYYTYTNRYFPYLVNYLITSDRSEEGEYIVDYGYVSRFGKRQRSLTKLDEGLIDLFIRDIGLGIQAEEWFEQLISRE